MTASRSPESLPQHKLQAIFSLLVSEVQDPRQQAKIHYPLPEILFAVWVSTLCGIRCFLEMELFCNHYLPVLRRYLPYKNGIPSHDTLLRVMDLLDSQNIQALFLHLQAALQPDLPDSNPHVGPAVLPPPPDQTAQADQPSSKNQDPTAGLQTLCVDGKALRGSDGVALLNIFCPEEQQLLFSLPCNKGAGERPALLEAMEIIDLRRRIVTGDAVFCYTHVVEAIRSKKGHYLLAVRDNQKRLHQAIREVFENGKRLPDFEILQDSHEEKEPRRAHGRLESRRITVLGVRGLPLPAAEWPGIQSIVRVELEAQGLREGQQRELVRYYISSLPAKAEALGRLCRRHWSVENQLHWVLDVVLGEDACRVKGSAARNLGLLRGLAVNTLRRPGLFNPKSSLSSRQRDLRWKEGCLEGVLEELFGRRAAGRTAGK